MTDLFCDDLLCISITKTYFLSNIFLRTATNFKMKVVQNSKAKFTECEVSLILNKQAALKILLKIQTLDICLSVNRRIYQSNQTRIK